jgi:O-antigen/teichoic acid export membrane protein
MSAATSTIKTSPFRKLTGKSAIKTNILWSLLGRLLPMGLAVFTIPIIIKGLGNERFGILTLIWMIVGYANLFDFGLGRALTQLVSQRIGEENTDDLPDLIWTTVFLLTGFGSIAAIALFSFAPYVVHTFLKVSPQNEPETVLAIQSLAFCLPIFFASSAFSGVLAAYQKFKTATMVNLPMLLFNFVGPLLVFPFTHNLAAVMLMLLLGRIITLFTNGWMCCKTVPNLMQKIHFNRSYIRQLFSFGGWMTVTNVISPLMVTFDRFLIANILTASVVAFYTTPFDVVSKLLIIAQCITNVLFPAFSTALVNNPERAKSLFVKSTLSILVLTAIPAIGLMLFAPQAFTLWINANFAKEAAPIAQVMSLGILINAISAVPFVYIQAKARPDITAKFHLLEFPVYALVIWYAVHQFGLIGAAWAWVIRVSMDGLLLFGYVFKKLWSHEREPVAA